MTAIRQIFPALVENVATNGLVAQVVVPFDGTMIPRLLRRATPEESWKGPHPDPKAIEKRVRAETEVRAIRETFSTALSEVMKIRRLASVGVATRDALKRAERSFSSAKHALEVAEWNLAEVRRTTMPVVEYWLRPKQSQSN